MSNNSSVFTSLATVVSRLAGRPVVFAACCAVIVLWAGSGPLFGFSDTWQLVINTGTTIVTFLMVFLIQNTQNRDNYALQAKLDELILTSKAQNSFVGIEHLTDKELEAILEDCERHAAHIERRAKTLQAERARRAKGQTSRASSGADASAAKRRPPRRGTRAATG